MKRVVSAGVLAMLIVGFAVYLPAHAQNPVAVSSSTLQSLTTETTVHATASHVVQPYGVYHELASGTLIAANGVDNVTISMTSGFPAFASYSANATEAKWSSGCQTETDKQSGANLVITYAGVSCGIAPTLKLTFSPLPSATDSCDLYWVDESYSWCGDSGFSYSAGVLTIVPPSATFTIDPTIYQSNSASCENGSSCGVLMPESSIAGDIMIVMIQGLSTQHLVNSITVGDSLSTNYGSAVVSQINAEDSASTWDSAFIFCGLLTSTGTNTVTASYTSQALGWNIYVSAIEVSSATCSSPNIATGSSLVGSVPTGFSTSTSATVPASYVAVGAVSSSRGGGYTQTFTAGSHYTLLSDVAQSGTASQYSASGLTASTNFPFTTSCTGGSGNCIGGYAIVGAVFYGVFPETTLLTMTVNAPPGGAIVYSGTTYSTSTVLTFTSTSTWTVTAAAFASYIFDGWSGFACSDLINPIQTCSITTISSYTTSSTVSSTLIASMSMNSSGASGETILAAFVIVGIILMLCGMAWAVSKR